MFSKFSYIFKIYIKHNDNRQNSTLNKKGKEDILYRNPNTNK